MADTDESSRRVEWPAARVTRYHETADSTGISRKNRAADQYSFKRMGGSEHASSSYKRNSRSRALLDSCARRAGDDGDSSKRACIRRSESGSRRSVLLWPILQGSLEVRTIRLRLATAVLFPTLGSLA